MGISIAIFNQETDLTHGLMSLCVKDMQERELNWQGKKLGEILAEQIGESKIRFLDI